MGRNILQRVNNRVHYFGPKTNYLEVENMFCPIHLTWDSTFTFDSSCKVFDSSDAGLNFSSSFDSSDFLFSSDTASMDM